MYLQGFGEILADVMTVNPALSELPSASSILDASNYTFQAITFGKDADGFSNHSHVVSTIQYTNGDSSSGASSFDDGVLSIFNYGSDEPNGASSYVVSATYSHFSSTYNSVPNDPFPSDTRLERGSTLPVNLTKPDTSGLFTSSLQNLGHYVNAAIDPQLSSVWNKVGAFAASSGDTYKFYDKDGNFVYGGDLTSKYNTSGLVDKQGFLTISPSSVAQNVSPLDYSKGSLILSGAASPSLGLLKISTQVEQCDIVTLVSFGSVKHLGVHCLDLKKLNVMPVLPLRLWREHVTCQCGDHRCVV